MSILIKLVYLKNPDTRISNPILFDASCSGIQHIASLTLEKELARNVNVYSESSNPKDDYPQYFYVYALDKNRDRLRESDIQKLRDINLNRKIIKRSVTLNNFSVIKR